jgi:TPR repeat protein
LGIAYETGSGISLDFVKARYWYLQAAEGGDRDAQNSLGHLLYVGLGGGRDRQQALQWFQSAADRGDPHAALNLGIVLSDPEGSESDRVAAVTWLEIARQRGLDPGSALTIITAHLTPVQAAAARRNALAWLSIH